MKVYGGTSGRRAMTDLEEYKAKGYIDKVPCYNSIFAVMQNPALTPLLKLLIEEAASPLCGIESNFAVDSSGFSTSTYARWVDRKHGKIRRETQWLKAHVMVGVTTNIITSVEITGGHNSDYHQLPRLVRATASRFNVSTVAADKAYSGRTNLEAIDELGAFPLIPFRAGTTGAGTPLWRRMYHFYLCYREEFLQYYHMRSNGETAFAMIKAKFGH